MDMQKLTEKSRDAMIRAQEYAVQHGAPEITPLHLLYSLLNQDEGLIPSIVTRMRLNNSSILEKIKNELDKIPSVSGPGAQNPNTSRLFSEVLI